MEGSPLCDFVLIGEIGLLPQLFSSASNPPVRVSVDATPDVLLAGTEKLQADERAAMFLAGSTKGRPGAVPDSEATPLPAYWA